MLAQVATDAKSNEITAMPAPLRLLSLRGTIVTAGALRCQRATARQIVDQGGDHALALKGNQGTLHDVVARLLSDPAAHAATAKPAVDAGHGQVERRRSPRIETRTATVSTDTGWLQEQHKWPGLAAIGKVHRIRETATGTTAETTDYLLSAALSPRPPERGRPVHWGIENQLHWHPDAVMNNDRDRTRLGHGPENPAVLRRMALNITQAEPSKGSLRGKLKRAGWDDAHLTKLLKLSEVP